MGSSDHHKVPICSSQGAVHSNVPVAQGQPQFLWALTSLCDRSHCLGRLLFHFPHLRWSNQISTYCPKRAKASQHFSQAKQRPTHPEWEPDPRCSLMVHQKGWRDVKGGSKDKSMPAGNKEQCFTTCPYWMYPIAGDSSLISIWNPGQTPKSTGCGKNIPHWPEVVKLPLFDTNKKHPISNIQGWGMVASSEVFKSTNSFLICAHPPVCSFHWETPCTRTSCSSGTSLIFVVLIYIFYFI